MNSPSNLNVVKHEAQATRNSCRVCAPLGSSLVFLGVQGCVPIIHGGQGCSTYVRRYLIGHFREPIDIASSNFSEASAVFGGGKNLLDGLANLTQQYHPELIGISTSCLSETMGEDIRGMIKDWGIGMPDTTNLPALVHVSTPSYKGSHRDGFYDAVKALVQQLATHGAVGAKPLPARVNLLPGFVSPADLRHLREICESFGLDATILPDYSQTLDDGQWDDWQALPNGGTTLERIRETAQAVHTIEFEDRLNNFVTAGQWLQETFHVTNSNLGLPIGIEACDNFFNLLAEISEQPIAKQFEQERARLLDSYVDAHKYAFGVRVAVFGDEEMVTALAKFLVEIGMVPVICATGGNTERVRQALLGIPCTEQINIIGTADYEDITDLCKIHNPALLIGNSKGYTVARELGIPLVRVGFPVQDRMGGQRLLHVGYEGTQRLFDEIINTWLTSQQDNSPIGYKTY